MFPFGPNVVCQLIGESGFHGCPVFVAFASESADGTYQSDGVGANNSAFLNLNWPDTLPLANDALGPDAGSLLPHKPQNAGSATASLEKPKLIDDAEWSWRIRPASPTLQVAGLSPHVLRCCFAALIGSSGLVPAINELIKAEYA